MSIRHLALTDGNGGGHGGIRALAAAVLCALVLAAGGCQSDRAGQEGQGDRGGQGTDGGRAAPPQSGSPSPRPSVPDRVADPVRVRIPAIDVDAVIGPLTIGKDRKLPPPKSYKDTGWWRDGPEPGEQGPAVIVGHLDSHDGPAVFARLPELKKGNAIFVDRADGTTTVFAAQRVERHAKDTFPTKAVYGSTPDPQLRLITCGGEYDRDLKRYLDNVIVYARHPN